MPFLTFAVRNGAPSIMSRFETLFKKLGLQDRYADHIADDLAPIDWASVYAALEAERQKVDDYLKKALRL
jgi:hypothetical protein